MHTLSSGVIIFNISPALFCGMIPYLQKSTQNIYAVSFLLSSEGTQFLGNPEMFFFFKVYL